MGVDGLGTGWVCCLYEYEHGTELRENIEDCIDWVGLGLCSHIREDWSRL